MKAIISMNACQQHGPLSSNYYVYPNEHAPSERIRERPASRQFHLFINSNHNRFSAMLWSSLLRVYTGIPYYLPMNILKNNFLENISFHTYRYKILVVPIFKIVYVYWA